MNRLRSVTNKLHPWGLAFGSQVPTDRSVVKFLHAKLTIQGIVHCSVVKEYSYLL